MGREVSSVGEEVCSVGWEVGMQGGRRRGR